MKNYLLTLLLCVSGSSAFAQITYDPAYFVKNDTDTVRCLIRNLDWRNSPTDFEYKLTESSEVMIAVVDEVSEFGFVGGNKYVRYRGNINLFDQNPAYYTTSKEMDLAPMSVFLKVLLEGKASLWIYENSGQYQYVMKLQGQEPELLLYKVYMDNKAMREVHTYRKQLYRGLFSEQLVQRDYYGVDYERNDFIRLFEKYNKLNGGASVAYQKEKRKANLALSVVGLATINEVEFYNSLDTYRFDKEQVFTPGVGLQLEAMLPFNRNKWSLLFETSFSSYKVSQVYQNRGVHQYELKSNSLNLNFGPRYYFFLKSGDDRIFINPYIGYRVQLGSSLSLDNIERDIYGTLIFGFEAGYRHKRWTAGIRAAKIEDQMDEWVFYELKETQVSVSVAYRISK